MRRLKARWSKTPCLTRSPAAPCGRFRRSQGCAVRPTSRSSCRSGKPRGWRETREDQENPIYQRAFAVMRELGERGIDMIRVIADRAAECGLEFIPSLRMNDGHFVDKIHPHENPMTSKALKHGQYHPGEIRQAGDDRWIVPSKSRENVEYVVARVGSDFSCGCPATSPTCYHVTSVVMRELREKGWVGQVWTTLEEAKRQRRKTWTLTRNSRKFWVTGRPAPEVRRPHKRGRFWKAEKDHWGPVTDCWWMVEGCPVRVPVTL